jgi:hypothetical protein
MMSLDGCHTKVLGNYLNIKLNHQVSNVEVSTRGRCSSTLSSTEDMRPRIVGHCMRCANNQMLTYNYYEITWRSKVVGISLGDVKA